MKCDIVVNGSMLSTINRILYFGDHSHIQAIFESSGELTMHHAIKDGLELIGSRVDIEIYNAAKEWGYILQGLVYCNLIDASKYGNPLVTN